MVAIFIRTAEDHNRQLSILWLLSDPFQDFVTAHIRQLEIQENHGGNRILLTIGKLVVATKVSDSSAAIGHDLNGLGNQSLAKGPFEREHVVLVVLHQEDGLTGQKRSAAGSSIQNRLPFLPSDSTPTCPPMRMIAFRTIARPTPVPS